jgi:hypothetical protein
LGMVGAGRVQSTHDLQPSALPFALTSHKRKPMTAHGVIIFLVGFGIGR